MTPALRGHVAMLVFSALVAGSFSLGSQAANHISPSALNGVRFGLAAILVGLAAFATTGIRSGAFHAPWRYFLLGGVFGVYFVLMFEGLKTAPPVSAAAVFTLTPLMSAGFGYVLLRQITSPRTAFALALGAGGALWVIFRADLRELLALRLGQGEAIYFVGCVAHAIYTPLVRKLNRGEPAVVFTFGTLVAAFILVSGWGWSDIVNTNWVSLPSIVWITLIYTAVFATACSFVLVQYAALRLPAAKVMAYTYLVPSWVIVWEIAFGHAIPESLLLVGVLMTVLALWMLLKDEGQPA